MKTYKCKFQPIVQAIQFYEDTLPEIIAELTKAYNKDFKIGYDHDMNLTMKIGDDETIDTYDYVIIDSDGNFKGVPNRHFEKYYEEVQ